MRNSYLSRAAAFTVFVLSTTEMASAAGFSKDSARSFAPIRTESSASARTSAGVSGKNVSYESTTWTETAVGFAAGGKIVEGKARAGTKVDYSGTGKTSFKSKNRAKVKLYVKGKNVMAKARASTHTTVYVGGKAYVVTQEVARAMTRFTPIGTTSAADATMSISAVSSGYLGVSRGATAAATVRVAN